MKKFLFIFSILSLSIALCGAQTASIHPQAVKDGEIKVDGILNENIWQQASLCKNFTILRYKEKPAAEATAFQVAVAPSGIFMAFRIEDKHTVATVKAHDGNMTRPDDVIELFISADNPLPDDPNVRTMRHLLFNFAGTRADGAMLAGVRDGVWTSDWKVAVQKSANEVTAEVFIPFYALDFSNADGKKLRFNVARENTTTAAKELSVWQATSSFADMNNFAELVLPENSQLAQFNWQINDLKLQTRPHNDTTYQVLTGRLSGNISGMMTLQAAARQNGKIMAFNRANVKVSAGNTVDFTLPLALAQSGDYQVTLSGRSNGIKNFYTRQALNISTVPFTFAIRQPVYRKSIFPDQADKKIVAAVDYAAGKAMPAGVKTTLTVTDADKKVIHTAENTSGNLRTFTIDAANWQPGKYQLTVQSSGHPAMNGTLSDTVQVIAPAKPGTSSVRLNEKRIVLLNGKPFFPRGFLGGQHTEPHFFEGMKAAGFNTVHFYGMNWLNLENIKIVFDKAHQNGLKIFCYPYMGTSIGFTGFRDLKSRKQRSPQLNDAQYKRLKDMVNMVKDHPALLGWYLADEPRGAELCSELKKVYQLLQELDPHHPVITLDFTAGGCLSKKDGFADIHILDMYPHPYVDGSWKNTLPSVFSAMKTVNENIGDAGVWFCPEAFTPRGSKCRPLTYREIRCLVFGTIVNGATGMVPYKIGSINQQYFIHARNSGIFYTPEMRLGYLEGIGPELNALENILTSPDKLSAQIVPESKLQVLRKKYNNSDFIIAVNTTGSTVAGTITLPGLSDAALQVISEDRSVKMQSNTVKDEFAPYAVHIYTTDKNFKSPVNVAKLEAKIAQTIKEAKAALAK